MALTDKLTAIANAIRLKRDISDSMTLDEMPLQISLIDGGGGGGTSIHSGTFNNPTRVNIPTAGYTIDIGLTQRAKAIIMWLDDGDYSREYNVNNVLRYIIGIPYDETLSPIRLNASSKADFSGCDRIFFANITAQAIADAPTGYGMIGTMNICVYNTKVWNCNADGTITISRPASGTCYLPIGTWHYIAFT